MIENDDGLWRAGLNAHYHFHSLSQAQVYIFIYEMESGADRGRE